MIEILKSFEQVAYWFSPAVLVLPGLVMTLLGLVAWLAGMCRRRLVLGLVGALMGATAGFFAGGQNPVVAGLAAGAGAVLGGGVPRLFAAVVLALFGGAIAFIVVARGPLFQEQGLLQSGQTLHRTTRLTAPESIDVVQAYVLDVADRVQAIARQLAPADLAIAAGVGAGLLAMGMLLGRPAGALTCSLAGVGMVFAGMTLLLIFKGSCPIVRMEQQGPFYGLVLLGMVAFGTLEQLLLCPPPGRDHDEPPMKSRSRREPVKRGGRNR